MPATGRAIGVRWDPRWAPEEAPEIARWVEELGYDELWMVELNPTFAAHLRAAFETKPSFRAAAHRLERLRTRAMA